MNTSTLHIIVKGKVQGVFYRASAKKAALALGLTGWVRNTPEGHVEIMAYGPEKQLNEFMEWCKEGPPAAKVKEVHTAVVESPPQLNDFVIR